MRLGLQVMRFDWPGGPPVLGRRLRDIAVQADRAGFGSLWVMDHFFQMGGRFGPAEDPMLEGYATLGYLAAVTDRIRLGTLVTGALYRNPGLVAKTVSTLDVPSEGRMYAGIGTGWYEREARGLGFGFPSVAEPFARLEESLQVLAQIWAGDRSPFLGEYYRLEEPIDSPAPLQRPRPPIMVGGGGERRTLRLVAAYADACNLYAGGGGEEYADQVTEVQHKLQVLRRHCEEVGRPYECIERTALASVHLTRDRASVMPVLRLCEGLAAAGIQHLILNMPNLHELWPVDLLASEVLPTVRGLA